MHVLLKGQRVILKANRREGWPREQGFFLGMSGKRTALVQVKPSESDDDGLREVTLSQITPLYNHPDDQKRRAHHAARLYRQGIRMFRLGAPNGMTFVVQMIDAVAGTAVGRRIKRKTVQIVALHDLWPEIR